MATNELSYGKKVVGLAFNPSNSSLVDTIKMGCADLIDLLHERRGSTEDNEVKRMLSIAITELQTSQMWAVKAVTWK